MANQEQVNPIYLNVLPKLDLDSVEIYNENFTYIPSPATFLSLLCKTYSRTTHTRQLLLQHVQKRMEKN